MIFADPTVLSTLSRREVVEGLAEAIKMGVIRDAQLFEVIINWDRFGRGIKQCKFLMVSLRGYTKNRVLFGLVIS